MFLTQIVEVKRKEIEKAKEKVSQVELLDRLSVPSVKRDFKLHINKPHHINLIAEIKRSSPSAGLLRQDFDPVRIAEIYQQNLASALSVLTDEKFFGGRLPHLMTVRKAVTLPILRKDFIIDEYQIYESAAAGADAILLITDLLSEEELSRFLSLSTELGMDVVVEVHSKEDVKKALDGKAEIIGINNRNLHTFRVDLDTTPRLVKLIPKVKTVIVESGIKTHEDVMFLETLGVNAVLIGEAFMRSEDIGAKVRELMGYSGGTQGIFNL